MLISLVIYLLLLVSVFALLFLQNSRSIFLRSLGLITIFISILSSYSLTGFAGKAPYVLGITFILGLIGFLSDLYSATLRTWFFRVSNTSMRATSYGIMIGICFIPLAFAFNPIQGVSIGMNISHGLMIGTVLGALVGEVKAQGRTKAANRVMKSTLGSVVGLYGMGTKILLGIEMIDIFLTVH